MAVGFEDPRSSDSRESKTGSRRSVLGRVVGGIGRLSMAPVTWLGARTIARGSGFIRGMSAALRSASERDRRFRTCEDGGFDLAATAFLHGISVFELKLRLAHRRRQTARIAYTMLALGSISLIAWVYEALTLPWTVGRIVSAVEFLPFCALFFLLGFYISR
jgi:hypothetical protein